MANESGYSNAEVKAGVFMAICLALFVAMLFIYGRVSRIMRGRQEIPVIFTSVTSLRPDAPVRYNGVEVGRVREITILPLDEALAIAAADLRAEWKRQGTPLAYADGLIAATAKGKNLILVTRNVRHFDHVAGLTVENWFEPPLPPAPPTG